MTLITEHDFETKTGRKKIVSAIYELETKVRNLTHLINECRKEERQLEKDIEGYQ